MGTLYGVRVGGCDADSEPLLFVTAHLDRELLNVEWEWDRSAAHPLAHLGQDVAAYLSFERGGQDQNSGHVAGAKPPDQHPGERCCFSYTVPRPESDTGIADARIEDLYLIWFWLRA